MRSPDLDQKLDILMSLAVDDREGLPPRLRHTKDVGELRPLNIRHLRPGPGMRMSLLRILMTNACSYNCHYCPMRRDRPMPRTLLKPEELVRIFLGAHQRGWCQGLFITTGIPGRPIKVMDDLIQVLELLRERHRFGGYIHVKLVAGSETAQIDRLTALASRVSLNFEAPCGKRLAQIAPDKSFSTTLHDFERVRSLVVLEREARAHGKPRDPLHPGGASGMTMQFVVGATPDTDRTLLDTVSRLKAAGGVHHPHFSAFRPISDTPMENVQATPALREHRLYQADWLYRFYGFSADEITASMDGGMLDLEIDPKLAWALRNRARFPINVNTAAREELLRIPGIGQKTVDRIIVTRRHHVLRLDDLARLAGSLRRARPFLITQDYRPTADPTSSRLRAAFAPPAEQLSLFG